MRSMPLARKLTLILGVTSAAALLLASGVLIAQWAYAARSWMIEDLTALAEITANNSQSSLAFQDPEDGVEVLSALSARAAIDAACLYDAAGEVFAVWTHPDYGATFRPPPPETEQHRMEGGSFLLFRTIEQNGDRLGTLLIQVDFRPFYHRILRNVLLALAVILVAILLASLAAWQLQRPVIGRIQGVVDMANSIATGALPEQMAPGSDDEIGELVLAFNQMVDATRNVVRQTQTLARGDYSISIEPRSDEDELSHALIKMTEALKGFHQENARQNWLKTALSELNERMRGEQDLATLNRQVLNSLAASIDAPVGALYLSDGDEGLDFAAGYGYRPGPDAPARFALGDGLVGQAARERRRLVLDAVPEDGRRVRSGLLDVVPRQLVAVPLIREEELIGVMEWGSVTGFTLDQVELLDRAAEAIAIAIHSAQSRHRLNQLVQTTRKQSEELQEQQAALRASNEELEQRARLLEKQKQEIHRQNQALENAHLDLERKARELASASRYKSEFLANMSHELRTPLNSMLILSKLLADNPDGNLTEKQAGFAATIRQAGSDLLTLINDILDLSKVEAGKLQFHLEPVEVADLRAGFEGIFQHVAADKGVAFPVTVEPGTPPTLRTDRQRVGQILRNLLSNAFKFTAQGEVRVRIYPPSRPSATHGTWPWPSPSATPASAFPPKSRPSSLPPSGRPTAPRPGISAAPASASPSPRPWPRNWAATSAWKARKAKAAPSPSTCRRPLARADRRGGAGPASAPAAVALAPARPNRRPPLPRAAPPLRRRGTSDAPRLLIIEDDAPFVAQASRGRPRTRLRLPGVRPGRPRAWPRRRSGHRTASCSASCWPTAAAGRC